MRQMVCLMAMAAMAGLFCAEEAGARGRRCSGGSCSTGSFYSGGCSTGGCFSGGFVGGGCSSGSCFSGGFSGGYAPVRVVPSYAYAPACRSCADSGMKAVRLEVTLPAHATLTVDNHRTSSTTSRRVFQSLPVEAGRDYEYTLKASVVREGKPVTVTKKVTVRAGETTRVSIQFPAKAVASR